MDRLSKLPHTKSGRFAAWLMAGNVAVAVVLVWATWHYLSDTRQAERHLAEQIADNLAVSVSAEVAAELRLIDNALQSIQQRLPAVLDVGDAEFRTRLGLALRDQSLLLPFVYAIRFADLRGQVNDGRGQVDINVADRAYFQQALTSNGVVVSEPMVSRVSGEWVIILARQVKGADGKPLGVVYAAVLSKHFNTLFSRFALGLGGAVALRTDQLTLVARFASGEPASDAELGTQRVSPALHQALANNPAKGLLTTRTALDGIERVNAYRRIPEMPLVLLAGLSTEHFVSNWSRDATRVWGIAALIQLMLMGGSIYAFVQHGRERRLSAVATELAKEQSMVIDNKWIGVARLKDRKITWANAAIGNMLGVPASEMVGRESRVFYGDADGYAKVGQEGYGQLADAGSYHAQVQLKAGDGGILWVDMTGVALSNGESAWVLVDITNLKHRESQAQHQAMHDSLTGLANRRLFSEQMKLVRAQSERSRAGWALCFLDLDGFKPVNDTFGHEAGDEVLKTVADRLRSATRTSDFAARMGGDEFALLLTGVSDAEEVKSTVQRCLDAISRPIELASGVTVTVGSSAGIAISHDGQADPHELLVAADEAMYEVKRSAKGHLAVVTFGDDAVKPGI
ncbi:diguanylate cyclase domain-containing protein [Hydrogenophaga defluvii]|uniref:Diguanylate cyclase domain-containing protein n=1 Tax=Hydrogenophaga defluvii TaxID=249410 RepID=A0ABW2SFC6_9BURK